VSAAPKSGSCSRFGLRLGTPFRRSLDRLQVQITVLVLLGVFLPFPSAFAAASLAAANADLQAGKADEAIAFLNETLKSDSNNAEANNLLCRVEYTLQQFDQAAAHCQKAVDLSPQNALYHHWLGRAIGERASRASFLSAFSLAKKTRQEFETAVKLDPHDADALADLGEFYIEAPGAVGGGMDKAEGIAKQLEAVDAARDHIFRAAIAEKNKDFTVAEQELKAAIAVPSSSTTHPASAWMALASFYRRRERWSDVESAVKSGQAAAARDRHAAVPLYNGASILTRANRQPQLAIELYRSYLASADKTEEAPAFDAEVRLAKLLTQTGDQAGAQRERAAALALAHDYKPALEIKTLDARN
jgi:tetratricopeptide (TPR) repeat protein